MTSKKCKTLITAITLFILAVNTSYFWQGKMGLLFFPAYLILAIIYLVLTVMFFRQLLFALKEKFSNAKRLSILFVLSVVLVLTFFFPHGFIDFESLEGKDLLVAEYEGAANCTLTIKLKEGNKFIERSVCFGLTEKRGDYRLSGDRIFFDVSPPAEFYEFAVFKSDKSQSGKASEKLLMYRHSPLESSWADAKGLPFSIVKNELTH